MDSSLLSDLDALSYIPGTFNEDTLAAILGN